MGKMRTMERQKGPTAPKITDLELEQWAHVRSQLKFKAIMEAMNEHRSKAILDPSRPPPTQEGQMLEMILGELYTLETLLMSLLTMSGLVHPLTQEQAQQLLEKQKNVAEEDSRTHRHSGQAGAVISSS